MLNDPQLIFETPRFEVMRDNSLAGDYPKTFYYIQKRDAVGIIVKLPAGVCLVKTDRHLLAEPTFELFGGRIEIGEDPLLAAKRELLEELGLETNKWQLITDTYPLPSLTTERLHIYLAEIENLSGYKLEKAEGLLHINTFSREELLVLLQGNEIKGSADALAIFYYLTFY